MGDVALQVDGYSGPRAGEQLVRHVTPERAWGEIVSHRRCVTWKQVKNCLRGFIFCLFGVVDDFCTFFGAGVTFPIICKILRYHRRRRLRVPFDSVPLFVDLDADKSMMMTMMMVGLRRVGTAFRRDGTAGWGPDPYGIRWENCDDHVELVGRDAPQLDCAIFKIQRGGNAFWGPDPYG